MTILTTRYPVVTLDGKELVPANTTITDDLLKQLIADGRTASGEFYPLVEHCSVISVSLPVIDSRQLDSAAIRLAGGR